MPIIVPHDVEAMVADQIASGRYQSGEDVLRSAMIALAEIDDDYLAIQDAMAEWQPGQPGTALADAFRQVREAGPGGMLE